MAQERLGAFVWWHEEATETEREQLLALLHEFEHAETDEARQEIARRARAFPPKEVCDVERG